MSPTLLLSQFGIIEVRTSWNIVQSISFPSWSTNLNFAYAPRFKNFVFMICVWPLQSCILHLDTFSFICSALRLHTLHRGYVSTFSIVEISPVSNLCCDDCVCLTPAGICTSWSLSCTVNSFGVTNSKLLNWSFFTRTFVSWYTVSGFWLMIFWAPLDKIFTVASKVECNAWRWISLNFILS